MPMIVNVRYGLIWMTKDVQIILCEYKFELYFSFIILHEILFTGWQDHALIPFVTTLFRIIRLFTTSLLFLSLLLYFLWSIRHIQRCPSLRSLLILHLMDDKFWCICWLHIGILWWFWFTVFSKKSFACIWLHCELHYWCYWIPPSYIIADRNRFADLLVWFVCQ